VSDAHALFEAHQNGLFRYLSRAVGHPEVARDLTQDVFVRVAQANDLPKTDAERRSWIFRVARNLAIDHHRRRQVREAGRVWTDAEPAGGDSLNASDTALIVHQALETLDDIARDVFLMREAAGLSYVEIASACDLTPDAVRSRIHRARLELREHLQRPIAAARSQPMRAGFTKD
jgi:RNA polymerase sigma-70 factor (ECF subfamily)